MATRPSQPALYEKMRNAVADANASRSAAAPSSKIDLHPPAALVSKSADENSSGVGQWLGPGRAIRLPTGYVLLGVGVAIMLLSIAYVIGHKKGVSTARSEFEQVITRSTGGISDPLINLQAGVSGSPSGRQNTAVPAQPSNTPPAGPTAFRGSQPSTWGPLVPTNDPRQKGLNYFILAETTETGAKALAEFCRNNGLETYVVLSKNQRRRVIAFPGFSRDERSSSAIKALEAKIHTIGQQWKSVRGSGGDDLSGSYPSLYNG